MKIGTSTRKNATGGRSQWRIFVQAAIIHYNNNDLLNLTWIPGYSGWRGNDKADALFKQGC